MKGDTLLLIIAIIAVAVAVIGAGITYNHIAVFKNQLTGFATEGTINLTVESSVALNFTTDNINFGSGRVDDGQTNATFDTSQRGVNNLTNGNWTGNTAGFVVENIGNKNITLNLSAGTDADDLLEGTNPTFQYNISDVDVNSCVNASGGADAITHKNQFITANTTLTDGCPSFQYHDYADTIRIDIKLGVPSDSKTGAINTTIQATFAEAA